MFQFKIFIYIQKQKQNISKKDYHIHAMYAPYNFTKQKQPLSTK